MALERGIGKISTSPELSTKKTVWGRRRGNPKFDDPEEEKANRIRGNGPRAQEPILT